MKRAYRIYLILFLLFFVIYLVFDIHNNNNNKYEVIGSYCNVKSYKYISNDNDKREDKNYIKINKTLIYTGIKWECVEYIRRFLIKNYHLTFRNVKNALEMPSLTYFYSIFNPSQKIPVDFIPYTQNNIVTIRKNDIIIFFHKNTGHVALVSKVNVEKNRFQIVEQNWFKTWKTFEYSRHIDFSDPTIIGWLTFF